MRLRIAVLAALMVVGGMTVHADPQAGSAQVMLEAAKKKELVDGDLKGAIDLYQKIADRFKTDRAVAAEALIRMAVSYEKLGNAASKKLYERILSEFADQPAPVAEARRHLGGGSPALAQMSSKRVWVVPMKHEIFGTVSRNGRYSAFVDWAQNGDLFVHDLATGLDRRITNTGTDGKSGVVDEYAEEHAFSRDGSQLAYSWFRGDRDRYELRLVDLERPGTPQFRVVFDSEDVDWIAPLDWSPDARWIAVQVRRKDGASQIGLVNVRERSLRVLKSSAWTGPSAMFFSKDGKYLAYDLPSNDPAQQRDIFVIAVDGSVEIPAIRHAAQDALLGWSPNGDRLVFASDRGGSTGIWELSFVQGRIAGAPKLLKRDVVFRQAMGISDSGVLFTELPTTMPRDIQVANVDLTTGTSIAAPVPAVQNFEGAKSNPDWSPDGKYLAYVSERGSIGGRYFVIGIRNNASGETREISPSPSFSLIQAFRYAPDGHRFVITGRDSRGNWGVFQVDAQTGRSTNFLSTPNTPGIRGAAQLSSNGNKIYIPIADGKGFSLLERDLSSGADRELIRRPGLNNINVSPSTQYAVVGNVPDRSTNRADSILLISTTTGEVRELMHVDGPQQALAVLAWAPDDRSIFVIKFLTPNSSQTEILRVPIDGSGATTLNLALNTAGPFRVHPDGKQIVYVASAPTAPAEVWALENFLSPNGANR